MHSINRYAKDFNRSMKRFDKNKSSYLKYWDIYHFCGCMAKSQKLPVNEFKLVEVIFEFDESFTKSYSEEILEGYFFEVDVIFIMIYLSCLKEWKLKKLKSLFLIYMAKVNLLFT